MSDQFPFNSKAFSFSRENALSLGRAAKLVYKDFAGATSDPRSFDSVIRSWGFDLGRREVFDRDGTQAFMVTDDDKIILSFRGTEPDRLEDWIADARIRKTGGPCGDVHRGFSRALNSVWEDVEEALEDSRDKHQCVWIAGHSLGAALATLAVARLKFREQPITVSGLYTYGQPRTGSERFADNFNQALRGRSHRIVNNNDVVTRVPPSKLDYSHVGSLHYFDSDGNLRSDAELSWWSRFWDRARGQLEAFAERSLIDGVEDHAIRNYVDLLARSVQSES